jgi:hypothetical protein
LFPSVSLWAVGSASDRNFCASATPSLLEFLRSSPAGHGRRGPARAARGSR